MKVILAHLCSNNITLIKEVLETNNLDLIWKDKYDYIALKVFDHDGSNSKLL